MDSQKIIETINRHGSVMTHFGDDFDNVVALEALRRAGAVFQTRRCPAGKAPAGEIWLDVCGPDPEKAIMVIDHHNGEDRNACAVLSKLGIYVPEQAIEVADMEGKPSATDYRSVLSLLRYLPPSKVWEVAEKGLLLETLSDEQIEELGLTEARDKQKVIVENAIAKIRHYALGDKIVVAEEVVLGGSFIAYELGYEVFASVTTHKKGGVTFAINSSKPLSEAVLEFAKSHGAFVPPHGKMAVLGGFKDPESRVEGVIVEEFAEKIRGLFEIPRAVRGCNCGSGEGWVYCSAEDPFCG